MADCYITSTGSFLPGEPVDNESINQYLGRVIGEGRVRKKILTVNGIQTRHYALDKKQNATHSLYELASEAVKDCLSSHRELAAGRLSLRRHDPRTAACPGTCPRSCTTS